MTAAADQTMHVDAEVSLAFTRGRRAPRLRLLPVPAFTVGSCTDAPFLLIIDRTEGTYLDDLDSDALTNAIGEKAGARATLIFSGEIDLDGAEFRDLHPEILTELTDGGVS